MKTVKGDYELKARNNDNFHFMFLIYSRKHCEYYFTLWSCGGQNLYKRNMTTLSRDRIIQVRFYKVKGYLTFAKSVGF